MFVCGFGRLHVLAFTSRENSQNSFRNVKGDNGRSENTSNQTSHGYEVQGLVTIKILYLYSTTVLLVR